MKKIIILLLLLFTVPAAATVSSGETIRQYFTCNGSTTTFTFTFKCNSSDDVKVYKRIITTGVETLLVEDTDYSIAATSSDYLNGGVVTISPALASTLEVIIVRSIKQSQETSSGAMTAAAAVAALDKLTRVVQDLGDGKTRSIRIPQSDATAFDMELPNSVDRAGKNLGFDASGNPTVTDSVGTFTTTNAYWDDIITKSPVYDIRAYGASESSSDNRAAIQTAIDAAEAAGGGKVLIPEGVWDITTTPLHINQDFVILQGMGVASVINQTTDGVDAIDIGTAAGTDPLAIENVVIRDLAIICYNGAGICIDIKELTYGIFENLYLRTGNNRTNGTGMKLDTIYYTTLRNIWIDPSNFSIPQSAQGYSNWVPQYGLHFIACSDLEVSNSRIQSTSTALYFTGGPTSNSIFRNIRAGENTLIFEDQANGGIGEDYFLNIQGEDASNANSWDLNKTSKNIFVNCSGPVNIDGSASTNLFIRHSDNSDAAYTVVGNYNTFWRCDQNGGTAPTDTGTGNKWIDLIDGSKNHNDRTRIIYTTKEQIAALPTGDTTPSIAGADIWRTANTFPTTITMLDDGFTGQRIIIKVWDAKTTFDFTGTNLKSKNEMDWTPTTNDTFEAVFDGTNWLCDTGSIEITDTVELTNANIKALRATPIELVAAQGADKYIEIVDCKLILDYGTNVLTESADNLILGYDSGATQIGETIEMTGFIDQSADTVTNWFGKKDDIITSANSVNKNVSLKNNGDGEFGGNAAADTTMTVFVTYKIYTLGL